MDPPRGEPQPNNKPVRGSNFKLGKLTEGKGSAKPVQAAPAARASIMQINARSTAPNQSLVRAALLSSSWWTLRLEPEPANSAIGSFALFGLSRPRHTTKEGESKHELSCSFARELATISSKFKPSMRFFVCLGWREGRNSSLQSEGAGFWSLACVGLAQTPCELRAPPKRRPLAIVGNRCHRSFLSREADKQLGATESQARGERRGQMTKLYASLTARNKKMQMRAIRSFCVLVPFGFRVVNYEAPHRGPGQLRRAEPEQRTKSFPSRALSARELPSSQLVRHLSGTSDRVN